MVPALPVTSPRSEHEIAYLQATGEGGRFDVEVRADIVVHIAFDDGVADPIREEADLTCGSEAFVPVNES